MRGVVALALLSVAPVCAMAQSAKTPADANVVGRLAELVDTQGVSGYETAVAVKVRAQLASLHPTTDNIGDVIVTVGTGAPHRLIVAAMDEPGFVVSEITEDGYVRVQRLPQGGMPAMFNELASAQPVKITTARGAEMDGVFAGLSPHLQRTLDSRPNMPNAADLDWMYVDVGATSSAEARKAGVDLLEPLALTRRLAQMNGRMLNGVSVGDRFGAATVLDSLAHLDTTKISGTLTIAFVVQQRTGARGLQRILTSTQADELLYVGRLAAGGPVQGMEGVHHAPRRDPGSGVLLGVEHSEASQSPFQAELSALGAKNQTPLAADYSAGLIPRSYLPLPALPAKWAHVGIAAAWPDTPAETVSVEDLEKLAAFLEAYETGGASAVTAVDVAATLPSAASAFGSGAHGAATKGAPSIVALLSDLTTAYGASTHEGPVRERVKALLPAWAKPETDDAGNLVVKVSSGAGAGAEKSGGVLVVAHMDEIGYRVKTISDDGRLEVVELGGSIPMFFLGHPVLVHGASGDVSGVVELPVGWDTSTFKWSDDHAQETIRVDVGARTAAEAAKLGLAVGDTITIPKAYRPLIGTRANARSFDDRVGCAALIAAAWSLGGPDAPALKGRDVTFAFSTGEEEGLVGAGKMAARLAEAGHVPATVFAVDTFVSSDSPLESKRYADAELGKGFVVRAVDSSNIVPTAALERMKKIAATSGIPMQYGVTSGGNDGSAFVRYGSLDVALGWPLRYSHSPAEVVDTRDVEALARIVAALAKAW
jgi:putative aminopeptidase FrvX